MTNENSIRGLFIRDLSRTVAKAKAKGNETVSFPVEKVELLLAEVENLIKETADPHVKIMLGAEDAADIVAALSHLRKIRASVDGSASGSRAVISATAE